MRNLLNCILLLLVTTFISCDNKSTTHFELTKNGSTDCVIIIPEKATSNEILAAKVLQDYLERISGAQLEIKFDNYEKQTGEILVGDVNRITSKPLKELGKDGFYIISDGESLIINGGPRKGVLYGVYTFLEQHLGCRKYSSTATYTPKQETIILEPFENIQVPAFDFRVVFYNDVFDQEYMDWHKLHTHTSRPDNPSEWGSWVHTFESLLSPEEYGETNPEYFSYYYGKRHPGKIPSWDGRGTQPESQLCLSNPKVLEIVCENLQKRIDRYPEAIYWSVSQNDNVNYCRCTNCAALDSKYAAYTPEEKMYGTHIGSQYPALSMGSTLTFINKVAERFPDKIISTLAYQHTRVPPKGIKPADNVNIMLCNIESTRNDPVEIGDKSFKSDLEEWGKLTDDIIVWDYTIQFNNLLAPFPNLRTLQPNVQFFKKNNVSAIFEQGNIQVGGEFAELRAYLLAKLIWDPDLDYEAVLDDFLKGYYGSASKYIKEYIILLHDNNQANTGSKMSIFGSPIDAKDTYLTQSLIEQYNELFEKAKHEVKDDPLLYDRVKTVQNSVYYAILEIAISEGTGERGAFILDSDNKLTPKPEFKKYLYDFSYHNIKTKVSRIAEWNTTPREYLEKNLKSFNNNQNDI